LARYLTECKTLRESIRTALVNSPIIDLPGTENARVRTILNFIASGQLLPVEKALSGGIVKSLLADELANYDLDSLGAEALYSWFSHFEYAEGLLEAGSLIVSSGDLPQHLQSFVDEARQCFAFQQYNAVAALCRTILEISVKDIATSKGILSPDAPNVMRLPGQEPKLHEIVNQLLDSDRAFAPLRRELREVRQSTNKVVHADRVVMREEAKKTLKQTLEVVHAMYEALALA